MRLIHASLRNICTPEFVQISYFVDLTAVGTLLKLQKVSTQSDVKFIEYPREQSCSEYM